MEPQLNTGDCRRGFMYHSLLPRAYTVVIALSLNDGRR